MLSLNIKTIIPEHVILKQAIHQIQIPNTQDPTSTSVKHKI